MSSYLYDQHPVAIGPVTEHLPDYVKNIRPSSIIIITDTNTAQHCWPRVQDIVAPYTHHRITVPAGEQHKSLHTCRTIWQALLDMKTDRQALVLNLGGGVIGDMGGFCAATYKRGISFLQIPTTLLAQVDASVGGKLGIDFGDLKNSVGVFGRPEAVIIDPAFLGTLPGRELRAGMAEVFKHALIADWEQWQELAALDGLEEVVDWQRLITRSVQIKRDIVAQDPFESGLRKALNFGHTIGHAIEAQALKAPSPLLHGEAVGIGMIVEAYLSQRAGFLEETALSDITDTLLKHYSFLLDLELGELFHSMRNDKKNEGGAINFSLIGPIGSVQVNQQASDKAIAAGLAYYQQVLTHRT